MNKPVLNHLQRQVVRWGKYYVNEKDPKKKELYLRQAAKIGSFIFKQKQNERE